METIIKNAVKVGNSAGILLPRAWEGCKVKAVLIEEPLNIKQDVLRILSPYLEKILGIYLVGSHARGEAKEDSDIDILAVSEGISKEIKQGRYTITLTDINNIKEGKMKMLFYILALIKEAKPLINSPLLEDLKELKLSKASMKWHIDMSKSALRIIKKFIEIDDIEENEILTSDAVIYSLILRLREAYIVDCLLHNKKYSTKEFMEILGERVKESELKKIYEGYNLVKNDKQVKEKIMLKDIKELAKLLEGMLKRQEK